MGRPLPSTVHAGARRLLGAALALWVIAACDQGRRSDAPRLSERRAATVEQQGTVQQPGMTKPAPEVVPVDAKGRPILPLIYRDACEGEDCVAQFNALACLPAELRGAANDSARIVTRVKAGDTLSVNGRDLHVATLGMVILKRDYTLDGSDDVEMQRVRRDTLRFARGDTLYLMRYFELGWWRFWYKGRVNEGNKFWARPAEEVEAGDTREDSTNAVARSVPETEDWWYVQPRKGMPGWWRADGEVALQSIHEMALTDQNCASILRSQAAADSAELVPPPRDTTRR